ncbi:unnamed protein product [Cylicocyclus nassatus]|uniref:Uncharacterized protein n=1 Tax=Cylicocyclus nassatus TaxID=53992 RepID=A0AA36GG15_CYLNA|nr:unnamed protein product [Cylicocyclus nassatus]
MGYSPTSAYVSAYLDIFDWKFLFLLVQMTISGIPIYTGILLVRKKIITTIQSTKAMSEKSRRTHSRLFKAITYQACLPLCGLTTLIFHILGSFITLKYPLCQYGYSIMGLVPVLSPLLTIYFVEPYRNWGYE